MSRYLTIVIFVYINTINIGFTFRLNHYHSYQLNKLYNLKSTVNLYAKKKTNKLISDELWTSLEPEDEDKAQVVSSSTSATVVDTNDNNNNSNVKSKTKKQSKQLISSDLLSSFIEDDNSIKVIDDNQTATSTSTSTAVIDKKNKKNKKKEVFVLDDNDDDDDKYEKDVQSSSTAIIAEDITGTAVVIDEKELTLEQKTRKEKPSARVRFIESSQPDFVSIGLENVGLMYGNDVILKSATFSISSGMIIIIAIMMILLLYMLSNH